MEVTNDIYLCLVVGFIVSFVALAMGRGRRREAARDRGGGGATDGILALSLWVFGQLFTASFKPFLYFRFLIREEISHHPRFCSPCWGWCSRRGQRWSPAEVPFGPFRFLTTSMLYGQVPAAKEPEISLAAISSNRAQALLEPWLAERMGLPRERLIRISNLLDFWAGRSSNPDIMVGRNNELYTREQLNDWCLHGNTDYVDDLARRLVKARQRLRALGKAFVFVISPSKAAMSPANIPRYCRPPATPRAIDRLVARLPADFPVVDSETILWAAQRGRRMAGFPGSTDSTGTASVNSMPPGRSWMSSNGSSSGRSGASSLRR